MKEPDHKEFEMASLAIMDMIQRVEKTEGHFTEGSAQHTLQQNRLHALKLALSLISKELSETPQTLETTREDLKRALAPIASLISKSQKAILKLKPGSWQYAMLNRNLQALNLVYPILENALASWVPQTARMFQPRRKPYESQNHR